MRGVGNSRQRAATNKILLLSNGAGDEAQLLPALRSGETAPLQNPTIEDQRDPATGALQRRHSDRGDANAWRFVDDEALRKRLKEAKGIGTPATRAEIIGGLTKQGFLIAQGKNIVPTETGLSLSGVLKRADPALVGPPRSDGAT